MDRTVWFDSKTVILPDWFTPKHLGVTMHQYVVLLWIVSGTRFGACSAKTSELQAQTGVSKSEIYRVLPELAEIGLIQIVGADPRYLVPDMYAMLARAATNGYDSAAAITSALVKRMTDQHTGIGIDVDEARALLYVRQLQTALGGGLHGLYQALRAWHVQSMDARKIPIDDPDELDLLDEIRKINPKPKSNRRERS